MAVSKQSPHRHPRHIQKPASLKKVGQLMVAFGRLSGIALILMNILAWTLSGVQAQDRATEFESLSQALPGISAADLCVGGHLSFGTDERGQHPAKLVCPDCYPLSNAAHALLVPMGVAVVLPSISIERGMPDLYSVPHHPALSRPWKARAPPFSV